MKQLEQLQQDECGCLSKKDGTPVFGEQRVGALKTLTVQNPVFDISSVIDTLMAEKSMVIPPSANAYVVSNFSGDTQFIRDEKAYSVYAIQFYRIWQSHTYKEQPLPEVRGV